MTLLQSLLYFVEMSCDFFHENKVKYERARGDDEALYQIASQQLDRVITLLSVLERARLEPEAAKILRESASKIVAKHTRDDTLDTIARRLRDVASSI